MKTEYVLFVIKLKKLFYNLINLEVTWQEACSRGIRLQKEVTQQTVFSLFFHSTVWVERAGDCARACMVRFLVCLIKSVTIPSFVFLFVLYPWNIRLFCSKIALPFVSSNSRRLFTSSHRGDIQLLTNSFNTLYSIRYIPLSVLSHAFLYYYYY